jgi:hypothetical protein
MKPLVVIAFLILIASHVVALEEPIPCAFCKEEMAFDVTNCPHCSAQYPFRCPDCLFPAHSLDGAVCPYCLGWQPPKSNEKKLEIQERIEEIVDFLSGSDEITFFPSWNSDQPYHTISGHSQITNFLGEVVLEPTGPCQCPPHPRMVFAKGTNTLTVLFCDHCFDVRNTGKVLQKTGGTTYFVMPKQVYSRIDGIRQKKSEQSPAGDHLKVAPEE